MDTVKLRLATANDAEIVFEWRNAPETRRYFFNPDPLNKSAHINWFEQSVKMPNRCLLIAETDNKPVGVLRYDFIDSQAEIDIYVAPELAGKGLGTKILVAGTQWLKEHFPHIKNLQAKVIAENVASSRIFDKAGFQLKTQVYEKTI